MIDCPVCPKKNIEDGRCPQCGTDISPLLRLKELPEAYFRDGIRLAEDGCLNESIESLMTAISLNLGSAGPYLMLGKIYMKKKLYDEAEAQFEKALEIDSDNAEANQGIKDARSAREAADEVKAGLVRRADKAKKLLSVVPLIAFVVGITFMPAMEKILEHDSGTSYPAVAEEIRKDIRSFPDLENVDIDVSRENDEIVVSGVVPSLLHKDLIVAIVAKTSTDLGVNSDGITVVPAPAKQLMFSYRVNRNDTLSHIAELFFGDEGEWKIIYNANRNSISHQDRIYEGQMLTIPIKEDLLVR